MAQQVDVVIVGGGFAGLSAALRLKDEAQRTGASPSYVVLDAGKTITGHPGCEKGLGGRTHSHEPYFDFGGGYVGSAQNYIQYLIRRFQVLLIKEYLPADKAWLYQDAAGKAERFPGNNPLALPGGMNAVLRLSDLDCMTLQVRDDLNEPWKSPLAELDAKTVQDYIDEQRALYQEGVPEVGMSAETADAFTASVRSAFSLEPSEISLFFLLYYAAAAGSYAALVDVAGGEGAAEGFRFFLGTQELIQKLVAAIGPANVKSDAGVTRITTGSALTEVVSTQGTFYAKRVIVAMAPTMADRIEYSPPLENLPGGRARKLLCARMGQAIGRTIKGFVQFKRPFWREQGLSGYLLSVARPVEKYPLDWTLDNVWDPAELGEHLGLLGIDPADLPPAQYSLMTFIPAAAARHWAEQSLKARAVAVIQHLQEVYGFDDAELIHPDRAEWEKNYVEFNWPAEAPLGMPSPAAMMPPGTLSKYGSALRSPIGPIHWAGTESAREWCGYMDGAVESGFRAAAEVLEVFALEAKPIATKRVVDGTPATLILDGPAQVGVPDTACEPEKKRPKRRRSIRPAPQS
ncbi:MAG TPA: FAD-dependent oxidoreductase [Polyangiaceae bacterium]